MKGSDSRINRRTVLRGAGVTMALPWLESLLVWGAEPATDGTVQSFPKRFAALFMGNGINPKHWSAKGTGDDMELARVAPSRWSRSRPSSTSSPGSSTSTPRASASIPGRPATSSREPRSEGRRAQGRRQHGPGARRRTWARKPPQPSLVLGCEQPITGYHETNFSMAYSSHISWQDALSPVPMEVYPSLAFDSLFDNQGSRRTQSILDRVQEQAAALCQAGQPRRPGQAR